MSRVAQPEQANDMPGRDPQGELGIIRKIGQRAATLQGSRRELRLGIGDDCALIRPKAGEDLVVTTDFSLEGRHFRRDWHSPITVGHRVLARGLSDLAAMGARPMAAFLSLALPRSVARNTGWLDGFLDGFLGLAQRTRTPLAGGDTAEAPGDVVLADIVLLGAVPRGEALRRDGAEPGDRIFVTGTLGGAASQVEDLQNRSRLRRPAQVQEGPHFLPEPRLRTGRLLARRRLARAAMDLSDGLSTDLAHLCTASGTAAEIEADKLPLHSLLASKAPDHALQLALHGGEDYELLFTASPRARVPARLGGVALTEIGRMLPRQAGRPQVTLLDGKGPKPLLPGGWEHLR